MKKILLGIGGCCVVPFLLLIIIIVLVLAAPSKTYSEEALQHRFDRLVDQSQRTEHLNPVTEISIDLHEGFGALEMHWEDGQSLTANIKPNDSGDRFDVTDVNVEGTADILDEFFQTTAEEVLESVLDEFIKGQIKEVSSIDVHEDELILHYK